MRRTRIDIEEASLPGVRWPALCVVTGSPVGGPADIPVLAVTVRRTSELALPLTPKYAHRMRRAAQLWRLFLRVSLPAAVILGVAGVALLIIAGAAGLSSGWVVAAVLLGLAAPVLGGFQVGVVALAFLVMVKVQHPRRWGGGAVIQRAHPVFAAEFKRLNGSLAGVRIR